LLRSIGLLNERTLPLAGLVSVVSFTTGTRTARIGILTRSSLAKTSPEKRKLAAIRNAVALLKIFIMDFLSC
jgi:hypothetical protein